MAVLVPSPTTGTSLTVTSRAATNRTHQLQNNRQGNSLAGGVVPVKLYSATTSVAATDTLTITVGSSTFAILAGMKSTTGTASAISITHNATDTVGVGIPNLTAGGNVSSPLIPVTPGSVVTLSLTNAVAASNAYIFEYGVV